MCRRCVYFKCDYSLALCASNGMKTINTLNQVHYPDQHFVHNIIMTISYDTIYSHKPKPNPNFKR